MNRLWSLSPRETRDSLLWSAYWSPSVHFSALLFSPIFPPLPLPFPPLPSSLWPPSVVSCFLQLFVHCHDLFYLDLSNNQISELLHKPHVSSHTRHASLYLVCTVYTNAIQILCSKDLVVESCVVLVGPHLGNSLFLLQTTVMLKGSVVYSETHHTLCYQ